MARRRPEAGGGLGGHGPFHRGGQRGVQIGPDLERAEGGRRDNGQGLGHRAVSPGKGTGRPALRTGPRRARRCRTEARPARRRAFRGRYRGSRAAPRCRSGRASRRWRQALGDAEVGQLCPAVGREQDVGGLDVAVNDPLAWAAPSAPTPRGQPAHPLSVRQGRRPSGRRASPRAVAPSRCREARVLAGVVDRDRVGFGQRAAARPRLRTRRCRRGRPSRAGGLMATGARSGGRSGPVPRPCPRARARPYPVALGDHRCPARWEMAHGANVPGAPGGVPSDLGDLCRGVRARPGRVRRQLRRSGRDRRRRRGRGRRSAGGRSVGRPGRRPHRADVVEATPRCWSTRPPRARRRPAPSCSGSGVCSTSTPQWPRSGPSSPPPARQAVTTRHLLTHQAGLPGLRRADHLHRVPRPRPGRRPPGRPDARTGSRARPTATTR